MQSLMKMNCDTLSAKLVKVRFRIKGRNLLFHWGAVDSDLQSESINPASGKSFAARVCHKVT